MRRVPLPSIVSSRAAESMSFQVTPTPTPESTPALYGLTLAGKVILVIFHGTRGEGVSTTPRAVSPLIELEIRGKTSVLLVTRRSDCCINLRF